MAMTQTETSGSHRVLLVDDDDLIPTMMTLTLVHKGFEVVAATNVTEALKPITTASFDVLITDLPMPTPSDGFAVITAIPHIQPKALTLLVSGYPDVKSAMNAILLGADEIIVKPFETNSLAGRVHGKLLSRTPTIPMPKERVAGILQRCTGEIVEGWLTKEKRIKNVTTLLPATKSARDTSEGDRRPDLASESAQDPRSRERFHLFRRCCSPRADAKAARLYSCDAGARLTTPSSDPVRDVAKESKCPGFQLTFT